MDEALLRELTPEVMAKPAHLFTVAPARGFYLLSGFVEWNGKGIYRGENPPEGALLTVARRYAGLPIPGRESLVQTYINAPGFIRKDTIVTLSARVEQPFGRFFVLGLRYDMIVDRTDFAARYRGGLLDVGGFAKHVAFLVGAVRF